MKEFFPEEEGEGTLGGVYRERKEQKGKYKMASVTIDHCETPHTRFLYHTELNSKWSTHIEEFGFGLRVLQNTRSHLDSYHWSLRGF